MGVVKCDKGHYYDDAKFDACPHCRAAAQNTPMQKRAIGDDMTVAKQSDDGIAGRALVQKKLVEFAIDHGGDEKTVGFYKAHKGIDPVVGWLVCVEGKEMGRDYRLHAGRNLVGRALNQDIALPDDARVTRDNHCAIVFEPRKAKFIAVNGRGDGLLVNGVRVQESIGLNADDIIAIGGSKFVFVPYCREGRTW